MAYDVPLTCTLVCVGWWYRPEFIINELNINATITSPAHDESVPLTQQPYTLRGYAYTGESALPCAADDCCT